MVALRRLALFLLLLLLGREADAQEPLRLDARALLLNPEAPGQRRVGGLLWRGGLELRSRDPDFGGLSALMVAPDGSRMTALSDAGRWVTARLLYDAAGSLSGLADASIGRLRGRDGRPLRGKKEQDAEALAVTPDGALLVAFERTHRIVLYPDGPASLSGPPRRLAAPPGLEAAPKNSGIEALVALDDGGVLALAEGLAAGDDLAAFLWRDGRWSALRYARRGAYRPSGAARLPDGDVIVLERSFSLLGATAARLLRIPAGAIGPGALLAGSEIATLGAPLTRDNFEGIAARRGPGGETLIYLISDDNFNPWQKTLLLMFALEE